MTPELRALLERIERAGGPVKPSVKTAGMFYALLPHTPHHPLTATLAPTGGWDASDDAILIHALKLDVIARGDRISTKYDPTSPRHSVLIITPDASGLEHHKDEATAHCLAWLAAFGPQVDQ